MTNPKKQQQGSLFSTATANSENALTTTNAATPATTLEQRVIKIQFHLQNIGNSIIIIGQELIECKKEVEKEFGYGYWGKWLADNFNMTDRTARNYIQIAERFGNSSNSQLRKSISELAATQLIALLTLPAGEEEKFIAEKAAEGNPVESMTVKTLREEIQQFKRDNEALANENNRLQSVCKENVNRADRAESKLQGLFADIEQAKKKNGRLQAKLDAADKLANQYHVERDILQEQLENQKPITVEPNDYQQLKKAKVQLQNKIDALQKQLANKPVEIVTPADYDETKKELARLQAAQSEIVLRMDIFQKLDTIADFIKAVIISPSKNGIQDYMREFPDKFGDMCADMVDFTNSYYKE